ncbi:unnamed protein product [Bursaphelenchus xylophilus]|uniref:(pine wood nematode) hypothetical protein n=1 Tax=Bursaphelenchus xylophilus TaxID=6326 RepID=A0A1I7SBJ4_BURXY|nr:unnamed protein product [Bursaphelenchus xylophilus]CAG9121952.1 unnamed protein product [Bursaphelenchus xylophilus]
MAKHDSFPDSLSSGCLASTSFTESITCGPTSCGQYFARSPVIDRHVADGSSLIFSKKSEDDDGEFYSSTIIRIYNKYAEKVENEKTPLYKRILSRISGLMTDRRGNYPMDCRIEHQPPSNVSFINYRVIRD